MKKLLIGIAVCLMLIMVALFVGPVTSGALLLLLPAQQRSVSHDLPADYEPIHKGHVSLESGLYFRENEDLIVPGTPALVLRRSYVSSYRSRREFGIGTTLTAQWFIRGDGKQFQWAELIRPGERWVSFRRSSPGTSFFNAMYVARGSADEWQGSATGLDGN
jgi:Domain of unknown function (DUF6531)